MWNSPLEAPEGCTGKAEPPEQIPPRAATAARIPMGSTRKNSFSDGGNTTMPPFVVKL
jgi:hypothetical protein